MKSSEFIRVDEGIGSWIKQGASALGSSLARAGIGTKAQQIAAVGAQMQREKQALGQALGQENNKNFLRQLPISIAAAIHGKQIDPRLGDAGHTPTGGRSYHEFISEYVKTLFSNFEFDSQTKSAIDNAVKEFADAYKADPPTRPVLSGTLLTKAQAIWNSAKAGSSISSNLSPQGGYGGSSRSNRVPYPTSNIDLPLDPVNGPKTGNFKFDQPSKTWFQTTDAAGAVKTPPDKIDEFNKIQQLNALAARI